MALAADISPIISNLLLGVSRRGAMTTRCSFTKALLWSVACLAGPLVYSEGSAQTYAVTTEAATSFDTVSTNVTWELADTDYPVDDDKDLVNIGFTFTFGTVDYTQVRIMSNAVLHFGADQGFHKDYTNEALPITGFVGGPGFEEAADRVIAGYWDDLEPSNGGTVRYGTLGTSPNRRFVASWEGLPHYNFGGTYSIQIVLYETREIRFRYGSGNAQGASATVGVEIDDSDYTQFSYNSSGAVGLGDGSGVFQTNNHWRGLPGYPIDVWHLWRPGVEPWNGYHD